MKIRKKVTSIVALSLILSSTTNWVSLAYKNDNMSSKNQSVQLKQEAVNLVDNPGFEKLNSNGLPTNWRVWSGGSQQAGLDTENSYEGNNCGYIVESSSLEYTLNNLKPNTKYRYSAYIKTSNEESSSILGVKGYGGNEVKKAVQGSEYSKQSVEFTTGNQSSAVIYLWDGNGLKGEEKTYIDNVFVEELPYDGEVEVKLNVSELSLSIGEKYPLSTSFIPASVENQNVTYSSSDENIVKVDEKGNIQAIHNGEATVTASIEEGIPATCKIKVTENKQPWYPTANENDWTLTMEDEFEGNELDTSKWTVRGKEYKTYHRSDMVSVEDGKLKLGIEREPDGQVVLGRIDNHGDDLSNSKTKFDQKYGFFEASAKIPPTEQTYFAFWMFNYPGVFNVDGTGRDGTEIDITETIFKGDSTESTLHWDGYDRGHKSTTSGRKPAPNIHDGFHRYGLEWNEDTLNFYFDGKLTWTYKGDAVPWVKEILILSSGLGMWGEGNINNAQLPYTAEIDWVRVYSKEDNTEDNIKPILYGLEELKVEVEDDYEEDDREDVLEDLLEDVWAVDNKDDENKLTKQIKVDESKLDVTKEGEYTVIYEVTDKAGNTTTKEREVHVVNEDEEENKVFNGKFQKGNLNNWINKGNEGENINSNNAGIVLDDEKSPYAYVSPNNSIEQFIKLEADTTYKLKAKAKSENVNGKAEIGVEMYGRDKKRAFISEEDWKDGEVIFTTDVEHTIALIYAYNAGSGKVFIDDYEVIEIDNPDKEAPIISGIEDTTIMVGDTFDPKEGVSTIDNEDCDLTIWTDVYGKVDTTKPGVYTLTYSVKDIALNKSIKTRKITVKGENTPPTITGVEDKTIKKGTNFNPLQGVYAIDNEDGDITNNIKVEGKVNKTKEGKYELTYKVEDSEKEVTEVKRVITVKKNKN